MLFRERCNQWRHGIVGGPGAKGGSHQGFPSETELCKRRIEILYISRRHEGIHKGGGGGGGIHNAFLHLIIMRDIHLDLLSNEWGPCGEEMFNI